MLTIAIIFITVLFASVVALMIILIEVIEKNDKLRKDRDQLNELNDGLRKENLELYKEKCISEDEDDDKMIEFFLREGI